MATLLAVVKAEYDYQAQNDEELTIKEDDLLYVLEDDDTEWWKVRVKTAPSDDAHDAPAGLVPAAYVSPLPPLAQVTSLYVYEPQNDEELAVGEDEALILYERDGDWVLVGRRGAGEKGVGYIPATWIDETGGEPAAVDELGPTPTPPIRATPAFLPPPQRTTAPASKAAGNVQTWNVTEIDAKKKKKKGTLGIGNGAIFFASESDKTPVQQHPLTSLASHSTEKSKHLYLSFDDGVDLHFTISSKSMLEEIVAKLEETGIEPSPTPSINRADSDSPTPALASTSNGDEVTATVLYDFTGEGDDELSVVDGERVVVLDSTADDWWKVRRTDGSGEEGVVPASYVEHEGASAADDEAAARADAEEEARRAAEEEDARLRLEEEERRAAEEAESAEAAAAASAAAKARASADAARREEARRKAAEAKRSQAPARPPTEPPRPAQRSSSQTNVPKVQFEDTKRSKPREDKTRLWRDRTGQFKVEAEFLGLNNGKIRLHKLNGVIIEVPIAKMSDKDAEYVKRWMERHQENRPRAPSQPDDDDVPLATRSRQPSGHSRPSTASSQPPAAAPAPARPEQQRKPAIDWFEFFLNAGCDMDDCTRYANNFQRDRIDEAVLPDLDRNTLSRLGLREGDVLRVLKHIRSKQAPRRNEVSTAEQEQIRRDEALARQLQGLPPLEPTATGSSSASGGSLFTGPTGALKTTRRGRPTGERKASDKVSINTITSATEQLSTSSGRVNTPPLLSRSPEPPSEVGTRRSSSTIPVASGFDDDAWTNRPASKPSTPAPPPAAPTPPPASPVQQPARPASAAQTSNAHDLNESILANLGIGQRPPSAPIPQRQQPPAQPAPQQPSYGPKGPLAPVASNQPMLNPLVPITTGNFGFVPTRPGGLQPSRSPMIPQQTGFSPGGLMPQATGYGSPASSMASPMTSMASPMMAQPTGFAPYQQYQPSPSFSSQPSQPSFQQQSTGFQPQATGYQPSLPSQQTAFQPQATGYQPSYGTSVAPQPTGYAGMVPSSGPSFSSAPTQSSAPTRFDPGNVFASMKQGTFAAKDPSAAPQPENKYDALRPQPTGMGFAPGGLVSQPTGVFAGFQAPLPGQQPQQQQPQQQYGQQYRQYY